MAVRTDKSVVYHIPKCGGVWVKEAMRAGGLLYGRCRDRKVGHSFGLKREHATPDVVCDEDKAGRLGFCFVRHPVAWLKSFWAFRVKTNYLDKKFPPDRIWDDDFEQFVVNMLDTYPDGFVGELYRFYTGQNGEKMDFIGRQENLADDLVLVLKQASEEFDEEKLRAKRWCNVAAQSQHLKKLCVLSDELSTRVVESESWVMRKFYD